MLISGSYKDVLRQMHADKPHWGITGKKYATHIDTLSAKYKCETHLDYGCGKKTLGVELPHLKWYGYDPGVQEFSDMPSPADMVVCCDVLEHVEPPCLLDVLDHLRSLTRRVGFFTIAIDPAHKHLPDGRNAHLIVEKPRWWMPKIMDRWNLQTFDMGDHTFAVTVIP